MAKISIKSKRITAFGGIISFWTYYNAPTALDLFMQQHRAVETSQEPEMTLDEINAEICPDVVDDALLCFTPL